ncbi:MAG: hypothetical protein OER90_16665 [Gemmatimonadota bacterium]|nr:hypothetical protein [Gemmatimonadota bacterium]
MRAVLSGVLALALTLFANATAQEIPRVKPGSVVRITAPDVHGQSKQVIGTLVSANADTIVVTSERDGATLSIPAPAVRRTEVWDATARRSVVRVVLISAGLGATAALGALTIDRAGQSLPEAAKWPGMVLVGAGMLAGPSAPSWYAGNRTAALVHLGVTAALATGFAVSYCPEGCTDAEERTMVLLMGGYALNWLVGTVDGAVSAARYRRWVEVPPIRFRAGVMPLPGGQSGVGISVRF